MSTNNSLSENFNLILDSLLEWAVALRHPIEAAERLVSNPANNADIFKKATRLWVIAFLVTFFLLLPIYQLSGVSWDNIGFILYTGSVYLAALMISCASSYLGLRINRINFPFVKLYAFYVCVFGIYTPFLTILFYPSQFNLISTIAKVKDRHPEFRILPVGMDIFDSLSSVYSSPTAIFSTILTDLALVFNFLIFFVMLTLLVQLLTFNLNIPKVRIIKSITFGLISFGMISGIFISLLSLLIRYSFY